MKKSNIYLVIAIILFLATISIFATSKSLAGLIVAFGGLIMNYLSVITRSKERKKSEEEKATIKEIQDNIENERRKELFEQKLKQKQESQAKIENERQGPDWVCNFCGKANPGKNMFCNACGNKKK